MALVFLDLGTAASTYEYEHFPPHQLDLGRKARGSTFFRRCRIPKPRGYTKEIRTFLMYTFLCGSGLRATTHEIVVSAGCPAAHGPGSSGLNFGAEGLGTWGRGCSGLIRSRGGFRLRGLRVQHAVGIKRSIWGAIQNIALALYPLSTLHLERELPPWNHNSYFW